MTSILDQLQGPLNPVQVLDMKREKAVSTADLAAKVRFMLGPIRQCNEAGPSRDGCRRVKSETYSTRDVDAYNFPEMGYHVA